MQYSYTERIKLCIKAALRDYPRTFDEIVKKCYGAYPLQVKQAMEEMKIYNRLVPLYFTQEEDIPYMKEAETDHRKSELITYNIENNPVLSNWYFSWQSCQKLSKIDLWQGKNLLFLGTPRLFEYFVIHKKGNRLTLIDLDENVTTALRKKYVFEEKNFNIDIQTEDINFLKCQRIKYDIVFLDPPWYLETYFLWLSKATELVSSNGKIIISMFPFLVRPAASEERKKIFNFCRESSKSVLNLPEYLEYDIPTFEKRELECAEIDLRSSWKISDLLILQDITPAPKSLRQNNINVGYQGWTEFNLFGFRWFISNPLENRSADNTMSLISLVGKSAYLDSPSRRNKQLKQANLQSSRGHGFFVADPAKFMEIIDELKNKCTSLPFETAVDELQIDEESKRIIEMMRDE